MAVAVPSSSTTGYAAANTVTINKPSGVVDGDLLVAFIYGGDSAEVNSVPSGWTLIRNTVTANALELTTYYKVASSEGASWQWGFDGTDNVAGGVARVTGQNPSVNIEGSNGAAVGNDDTPSFANTITPTQANSLIFFVVAAEQFTNNNPGITSYAIATDNPTWTELFNLETGDHAIAVAYALRAATSATGNSSCDLGDGGNTTTDSAGQLIVIPPRIDASVSPAVITASFSVQAPISVGGGATTTPAVITASFSVQAPSVTTTASDWSNLDKSSAGGVNNETKS